MTASRTFPGLDDQPLSEKERTHFKYELLLAKNFLWRDLVLLEDWGEICEENYINVF